MCSKLAKNVRLFVMPQEFGALDTLTLYGSGLCAKKGTFGSALTLAEKRSSAIQLNKGALTPAKKSSSIGSNAKDCSVYTILPITTHSGPPYVQSKSCTYLWQPNHAVLTTFKLNLYVCRMGHFPLLV